MVGSNAVRLVANLGFASAFAIFLGACNGVSLPSFSSSFTEPVTAPETPTSIRAAEIVGRWGLASFQNPNDRPHAEVMAKTQCKQPYTIRAGANGGLIMHLPDHASPQELHLKGAPDGKTYIGPPGQAGGEQDREIVSFNDSVLITRFVDQGATARYGNTVYVRCAPSA
jgi:hypothetical protein